MGESQSIKNDTTDTNNEVINLLQQLVQYDSADPPGREIDIANFVAAYLRERGVECFLDEFLPGRANVLARVPGKTRDGGLVFSSHLDTVPVGSQPWRFPPLSGTVEGERMFGRGTSDMKSALAAMMVMVANLARNGVVPPHDVVLALSAGESSNCLGSKRFVAQNALSGTGAIVVGEPSSLDVIVAHMAVVWVRISTVGKMGHVSGDGGKSAISTMMSVMEQLPNLTIPAQSHALCSAPTINVGTIQGGSAVNVTPDLCTIEVDVRVPPGTPLSVVEEVFGTLAAPDVQVEFFDKKPAVETSRDHPLTQLGIKACLNASGTAPKLLGVSYYSDATVYCAETNLPFVIIGPGELGMSGAVDESVSVDSVQKCVGIYMQMATEWHQTSEQV